MQKATGTVYAKLVFVPFKKQSACMSTQLMVKADAKNPFGASEF